MLEFPVGAVARAQRELCWNDWIYHPSSKGRRLGPRRVSVCCDVMYSAMLYCTLLYSTVLFFLHLFDTALVQIWSLKILTSVVFLILHPVHHSVSSFIFYNLYRGLL